MQEDANKLKLYSENITNCKKLPNGEDVGSFIMFQVRLMDTLHTKCLIGDALSVLANVGIR